MTDHTIPGRDVCHVRANFKNDSPSFMSEKMRKKLVRAFNPIDLADLRPANARGVDLNQHLPAFERRNFEFIDDERLALLDQNGGLGFQGKVLATDGGRCFSVSSADTVEIKAGQERQRRRQD